MSVCVLMNMQGKSVGYIRTVWAILERVWIMSPFLHTVFSCSDDVLMFCNTEEYIDKYFNTLEFFVHISILFWERP